MIRLQLRLIIAAAFVALLAISTGTALAGPSMEAGSVTVSPTTLTETEGLGTPSYTLVLGSAPTGNVTITASVGTSADLDLRHSLNVSPVFTFTTTNWNTAQTVFFRATNDTLIEGTETHTITNTIAATSDTTNYPTTLTISDVTVTVIDRDADVTLSATAVAVTEGGTTAEYTVALGRMPAGTVTMTAYASTGLELLVDTDSDTTGDQSDLTFTTTNWNTAQTVTVKAVDDDFDEAETETVLIRHRITVTGDASNYPVIGQPFDNDIVAVTITDNDDGVIVSETAVTATEGLGTPSYTLVLRSAPTGNVTITASVGTSADLDLRHSLNVSPVFTFTTTNWNTAQTVFFRATNDTLIEGTETHTITNTIAATSDTTNYPTTLTISDVTVTVIDRDADVTLSATAVAVTEGGTTAEYTVALGRMPAGTVTMTAYASTGLELLVDTDSDTTGDQSDLTFTTTNWNTAQTVTVKAVDDDFDEAETDSVLIRHEITVTGDASNYPVIGHPFDNDIVAVTVTDDDTAGVSVSETAVTATEDGTTGSYTIKLDTEPRDSYER